jgi:hypothetical protein
MSLIDSSALLIKDRWCCIDSAPGSVRREINRREMSLIAAQPC